MYHTYKKTTIYSDNEDWPKMSACHAGMFADNRTPVGFFSIIYRKLRFGNRSLRSCERCPTRKCSFLAAGMALHGLHALRCADRHGTRSIMPGNFRNGGTGEQRLTVRHAPPETPT